MYAPQARRRALHWEAMNYDLFCRMQDDMTKKVKGTALILDLCCHVGNLEHLIQV